jgi:hypothetical protein
MAIRGEIDVVIYQEDGVAARPIEANIALNGQPSRSGMHVIQSKSTLGAHPVDLITDRGCVAGIHDAKLVGKNGLGQKAADGLE